jgi:hypothetical protein
MAISTWCDRDPLVPLSPGLGLFALSLAWASRPWLLAPLLARPTRRRRRPIREPGLALRGTEYEDALVRRGRTRPTWVVPGTWWPERMAIRSPSRGACWRDHPRMGDDVPGTVRQAGVEVLAVLAWETVNDIGGNRASQECGRAPR